MIWTISWRNVWRNKLRSTIVLIAVAIGVFAGIFSTAFMKGMTDQRIRSAIETEVSHIQIHKPGFTDALDINKFINNSDNILKKLRSNPEINSISKRIIINAMAASAETATGVKLIGVIPQEENKVTTINKKIIEGKYFEGIKRNPIIIGKKLAEKLNLKLRSKIIVTFQDYEGNITGAAFRIAGIYKTGNSLLDEFNIYVKFSDLVKLSGIPDNTCHEIAIKLTNGQIADNISSALSKKYLDLDIQSWKKIKPELSYMTSLMDVYMYVFIVIILFALGFGIINTMLMVVLERTKELGMLMAVGMNRKRIFSMIVLETVFLTLTGGFIGVLLGYFTSKYFSIHPINLSWYAKGLSKIGWESFVYTSINIELIINVTLMVIITGIIAAIYPAYKALRNDPAEALRME